MRVTVGISFYNSELTLTDAIRSVFAQRYQDWELILIDDGSTDGSLDIAKSVNDPRVRVVSDGRNKGLHARLNQISGMANGEYIARMDSDDIMHPERLKQQVQYLDLSRTIDVVGTAVYTIDGQNQPNGIRNQNSLNTSSKAVLQHAIMAHPTITGRAEWFRNNPYNESFIRAEDFELWCRTHQTSLFASLESPLYYFREGARNPWKYLKDYLKTASTVRKTLMLYGPSSVGWTYTLRLIVTSYLKDEMYCVATLLGIQKALIARRNRGLSESERSSALEGLVGVFKTPVPGVSTSDMVNTHAEA